MSGALTATFEVATAHQSTSPVAPGICESGDATDEPADDEYRSRLRPAPQLASRSDRAIGPFVGYWRRFRLEMQEGDVVAVPLGGRRVAIGKNVGGYAYRPREPERRLRPVRSLAIRRPTTQSFGRRYADAAERLRRLAQRQ